MGISKRKSTTVRSHERRGTGGVRRYARRLRSSGSALKEVMDTTILSTFGAVERMGDRVRDIDDSLLNNKFARAKKSAERLLDDLELARRSVMTLRDAVKEL